MMVLEGDPSISLKNILKDSILKECIICNSIKSDSHFDNLRKCQYCGHIFFNGVGGAELYQEKYFNGEEYPNYLEQEFLLRKSMRRHIEQLSEFIKIKDKELLEVGSAYGFFLDEARKAGAWVRGMDVCEVPCCYAKDELSLDVTCGDFIQSDDIELNSLDIICMWDTIEHLDEPHKFIEKCQKLLKKDGYLFITTADILSMNARVHGKKWRQIHPPTHIHYFSKETMGQMCENYGFEKIAYSTSAYYHNIYNILRSIIIFNKRGKSFSKFILKYFSNTLLKKFGFWLNLGDIMFFVCKKK